MSDSCSFERRLVRLDGGDDGLDGDAAVGDQLTTGTPHRRAERRGPHVLVDEDRSDAARIHRGGEVRNVVLGQRMHELGLESGDLAEFGQIGQLHRVDRAIVVHRELGWADLEELGELARIETQLVQTLAADDVDNLAAAMDPGSVAAALVYENLWAAPFGSAMRRAGGQLIANGRIPIQAIIAAVEDDAAAETEGA